MNPKLSKILEAIQQSAQLSAEEKAALAKSVANANKDFEITAFKLERTEKVKQTTAILLEETIAELEQKRLAVEKQNQELEIESALERLRTQAMGMQKADDLPGICEILFNEFRNLGFRDLRNAMINIHDDEHASFINYDYSDAIGQTITPLTYDIHPLVAKQMKQIRSRDDAFSETSFAGEDLKTWIAFRKNAGEPDDPRIENADALHYYFYSIGTGSIGISTFTAISPENQKVLLRFRNVFEFAYRRYVEVTQAEEQAREAQIELSLERVRARAMAMRNSGELAELVDTVFKELTKLHMVLDRCIITVIEEASGTVQYWMANPEVNKTASSYLIRLDEIPYFKASFEAWKQRKAKWVYDLKGEEKKQTVEYIFSKTELRFLPEEARKGMSQTDRIFLNSSFSNFGSVQVDTIEPLSDENLDILYRFGKVFDMTYTRFNDLKQAEAQAREAKIEAALEKVRSRAMAMYTSRELEEVAQELRRQMGLLGQKDLEVCAIHLYNEEEDFFESWSAMRLPGNEGQINLGRAKFPRKGIRIVDELMDQYKAGTKDYVLVNDAEKIVEWFSILKVYTPDLYESIMKGVGSMPLAEMRAYWSVADFSGGALIMVTYSEPDEQSRNLLRRTSNVFELAYTRFMDLQKAEAQAREAKIEAALEKVRSRTMAMQRSEELSETAAVLFQEFKSLGEDELLQITIGLYDEANRQMEFRVTSWVGDGKPENRAFLLSMEEPTLLKPVYQAWIEGKRSVVVDLKGEQLEGWLKYRNSFTGLNITSNDTAGRRVITCAFFSKGHISISSPEPRSAGAVQLLERFAGVFDLTYTRFLDLKNAEAQAREAQIEAAMERTRTQSMIMQHSKELDDTLRVFHQQVLLLGIPSAFSFLWLPDESKDRHRFWAAWAEKNTTDFKSKGIDYPLDRNEPATAQCLIDWKSNEPVVSYHVQPDGVQNYFAAWSELIAGVEQLKPEHFSEGLYYVEAFMKYGCFGVMVSHELKEEERLILARFATEFERTYTRFLDLQKAEAQAKEAQVEAALERVRSKTMAMHNSQDVGNTVATMFDQLVQLGVKTNRCGILIFSTTENAEVWTARSNPDGSASLIIGHLDVAMHPMLVGARQSWVSKAPSFTYELKGDDIVQYYQSINNQPGYPVKFNMDKIPAHEFHSDFIFPEGAVFAFTSEPIPEESALILKRFAGVFGQTYRRYLDLQKAEAQAIEAIKRASVDRIRAEIASMRTTSDLERIQPLIWNELKTLGVPFIRCGVFIMDEENSIVQTMLSTPDGKAIATLHVPFDFELSLISNVISYWRKKELYQEYWDADAFARNWVKLSSVRDASGDTPQNVQSPEHLYLHMLPFLQGMLYVGNNAPLKEDELKLVQNLADAFAAAYARYEDFNKLESAKQQVENTLTDLKQAQQQLIQAEKMASLGELTAGIAHEIQNPLNFVNNFSEVNAELIEEMKQEIEKGNLEEVKALADDIRDNQEKITHHGKRADGIVKGMLQHSRSSSGQKELTDINVLADEYLRLAYHGLRAKDKTFNAAMHTDYDPSIGKIAILPQDMGRVILNLITNAFYVVDEKKKASKDKNYEPAVTVKTERKGNTVLISVKDNGNGIPKNILDKIFQPFFTTKPTGQGTGLGLSLSYDIVKAHGGELTVETKEGEGCAFCISIPVI